MLFQVRKSGTRLLFSHQFVRSFAPVQKSLANVSPDVPVSQVSHPKFLADTG